MSQTLQEKNKALLLAGFDVLFNKRDFVGAEKYWSPNYIQHSSHIEPGREGLFNLVKSLPSGSKWEHGIMMAEGDYVMIHSRYSNPEPAQRKPRTDAQRNRERILGVAKEAFTRRGANASLDDIAKEAGVGAGTLYRHFPSRDALIEAVYRTEVEKLATAQREFAETMPPIRGLACLDAFIH
jgi:predicted SnoaL-like aldol condensation-catalyzing enzyme